MQQRESPKVEPNQSAPLPDKLTADRPGERAEKSVQISVTVYHRLKKVSLNTMSKTAPSCGSLPRSSFAVISSVRRITETLPTTYEGANR